MSNLSLAYLISNNFKNLRKMRGEREKRERGISECVIWNPHERIGHMRIQFNTKGLFVYEEQFLKTVFCFEKQEKQISCYISI